MIIFYTIVSKAFFQTFILITDEINTLQQYITITLYFLCSEYIQNYDILNYF